MWATRQFKLAYPLDCGLSAAAVRVVVRHTHDFGVDPAIMRRQQLPGQSLFHALLIERLLIWRTCHILALLN